MRRTFLLVCLIGLGVGCADESAANRAQTARQLDSALDQLREASTGYVPKDQAKPNQTLSEYRQKALQENVEVLTAAAESGSPTQRVASRRLLADVHASAARHHARRGAAEGAALANRASTLVSYLIAVDRADSRATAFNTEFSGVLNTLETELASAQQDERDAKAKDAALQPQIDNLQARIADLRSQSATLRSQAEAMRRESFNLEGEAKYDRMDEADRVLLAGDNAEFEAQRLTVDLENLRSQAADVARQLAATQQKIKLITDVRAQTTQRQADNAQLRDEAQADRSSATSELMAEFKQVADAYDAVVVATFEKALSEQKLAIEAMERARADVGAADASVIEADMLGKLLDKVYVLSEYAGASGEFGRSIDSLLVRADALMPDHADTISAVRRQVADRQARLIKEAGETTAKARELIEQLRGSAPDGSDAASALAKQQKALESYARQLQQVSLEGA